MRRIALLLVLATVGVAHADDALLRVRSRLRVEVDAINRDPEGLLVRGTLRDDADDEPVPGRTIAVSADGDHGFYHYAEPSGPDGRFRWRIPLAAGSYHLRIGAGGDDDYAAAAPVERTVDVGRRTAALTLHAPERLAAGAGGLRVVVDGDETDGDGVPHPLGDDATVTVMLGRGAPANGRFRDGSAAVNLPALGKDVGQPGQRLQLVASLPGTPLRNPAEATRMVLLTATSSLTLETERAQLGPSERVRLVGQVDDDAGPIAGAAVSVGRSDGPPLGHAVSDERGRFAVELLGRDLGQPGEKLLEARYLPPEDWREPAVSPTVPLQLLPSPPITIWPYLVSPALTLLLAALATAARSRRGRPLQLGRRTTVPAPLPPPTPGLTESRPGFMSALRARADYGLTGIVVDAGDDRPLPFATVVARSLDVNAATGARAVSVDEHGRFALEDLPPGPMSVEIAAEGYVGERFTRSLPHRGELRDARVRLVPLRRRIFEAWQRAAAPLLPAQQTQLTPRELLRHVEARALLPHEPLAALTALTELAVWAGPTPSSADLAEAERLAQLVADS